MSTSSDSVIPDYFGRERANSRVGLKSPTLTYARLELGLPGDEWQLCQIISNKNVLSDVKCAKLLGPAKYHIKDEKKVDNVNVRG